MRQCADAACRRGVGHYRQHDFAHQGQQRPGAVTLQDLRQLQFCQQEAGHQEQCAGRSPGNAEEVGVPGNDDQDGSRPDRDAGVEHAHLARADTAAGEFADAQFTPILRQRPETALE